MKFTYEKEDDVLMVYLSKEKVDYAEQEKNVIVHFSKTNKPVLIEILDALSFLKKTSKVLPAQTRHQIFA